MTSIVFTFSLENYNFGSKKIYMDVIVGSECQMLISALDLSKTGSTFAIYMFTRLELVVAQLAPMNNLPLPPLHISFPAFVYRAICISLAFVASQIGEDF